MILALPYIRNIEYIRFLGQIEDFYRPSYQMKPVECFLHRQLGWFFIGEL